jgi:hypothetical protein
MKATLRIILALWLATLCWWHTPVLAMAGSTRIDVSGGTITLVLKRGRLAVPQEVINRWVRTSANAVISYYGRFPMKSTVIEVTPSDEDGVGFSTASFEDGYALIEVPLGSHTSAQELADDWTLTHEMVHLAFPLVDNSHRWLAEGIATYVEPIARMRMGIISPQEVWGDLVKQLPNGLPGPGDRGLNRTPTWGRIYWGGALYCLVADIEIRAKTKNRMGLQDAMRGILNAGADIGSDWQPIQALEAGDRATGTTVLVDWYKSMRNRPVSVDLNKLWSMLGVKRTGRTVMFDDSAPYALMRAAINRSK